MNMGEKINFLRTKNNMTLEELGNKVGVGKSTVRKWENGIIANMKRDKIAKLSEALNTTPAYLMGWQEELSANPPPTKKRVKIPVLGEVPAGVPVEAIEDIIDYEEITEEMARTGEYFGLRIKGDSMSPRIMEGDIVIVRQQDDAESSSIVIVLINGYAATCKRLVKNSDGINLISFNPMYEPMFYSNKEIETLPVKIIGKVVENRQKY